MSADNITKLIIAAQYIEHIEQQERLKESPPGNATQQQQQQLQHWFRPVNGTGGILNSAAAAAAVAAVNNNNRSLQQNRNNNSNTNSNSSSINVINAAAAAIASHPLGHAHAQLVSHNSNSNTLAQVSTSAPAAAATFHHTAANNINGGGSNGTGILTISNSNGSVGGSSNAAMGGATSQLIVHDYDGTAAAAVVSALNGSRSSDMRALYQLQQHTGGVGVGLSVGIGNPTVAQQMIIDDNATTTSAAATASHISYGNGRTTTTTPPTTTTTGAGGGGQLASPPRGVGNSNYQLQMLPATSQHAAAALLGSQVLATATSLTGGSGNTSGTGHGGRRRTISSNSNGAGTREVHNKLEKNRRAHLKECYERLKNELHLQDEDRKKTSNLAILGEAYKHVVALRNKDREQEAEVERLAKEKIFLQKRLHNLKRDTTDLSIPIERSATENIVGDAICLATSSGVGSGVGMIATNTRSINTVGILYDAAAATPIGAGLQTALPTTTLSSVITNKHNNSISNKNNNNNNSANTNNTVGLLNQLKSGAVALTSSASINASTAGVATLLSPSATSTSLATVSPSSLSISSSSSLSLSSPPSSATLLLSSASASSLATSLSTSLSSSPTLLSSVASPASAASAASPTTTSSSLLSANTSPAGSPSAHINNIVNGVVGIPMPLSLTAKNISATSATRGSPTPSTPSPSPSSSSGVSSSSSFISSSPPMNGIGVAANTLVGGGVAMINTRNVTVNLHNGNVNGGTSAAATIIATSAPGANSNNVFRQTEKDRNYNFLIRGASAAQ